MDDKELEKLMGLILSEQREAAENMLSSMDDMEKAYFKGFVKGYSLAVMSVSDVEGSGQGFI